MSELENYHMIKYIMDWWHQDGEIARGVFLGMVLATRVSATYYDELLFLYDVREIRGDL